MSKKKNEWLGFYKEFKLHKACANDEFHPAMQYICFRNGYAYATDGHIAVRASLDAICALSEEERNKLNCYLIHKKQYEMLLKYSTIEIGEGVITCIDSKSNARTTIQLVKLAESSESKERAEGKAIYFPNVDAVFNDDLSKEPLQKVGFNYQMLIRIIAAMGITSNRIGFRFTSGNKPIVVLGVEPGIDVRGIIMPMMLDE